jgi:hypothetical protein
MCPFFATAVVGPLSGLLMAYALGGFSLSNIPRHLDWPALGLIAMGALALAGGLHMIRREQCAVSMLPPRVVSRKG